MTEILRTRFEIEERKSLHLTFPSHQMRGKIVRCILDLDNNMGKDLLLINSLICANISILLPGGNLRLTAAEFSDYPLDLSCEIACRTCIIIESKVHTPIKGIATLICHMKDESPKNQCHFPLALRRDMLGA